MAQEHAGMSLAEMLWEQADAQYAKLKELHEATGGVTVEDIMKGYRTSYEHGREASEYLQTQGKVQALAFAVGTILFPYFSPKERIDKVRPMLAERWADNNPEEDEEDA